MPHAGPSTSTPTPPLSNSSPSGRREYRESHPRQPRLTKPWWTGAKQPLKPSPEDTKRSARPRSYVPYKLKNVLKQCSGDIAQHCQCVEFFPFIGSKRPSRTLQLRDWDIWEDAAAYCVADKVMIGRCQDNASGACWEPIWQIKIKRDPKLPTEDLYHVTWSIDPFTLHPLIIAGGALGLIYVFDPVTRVHMRTLRGHGDNVQALAVCPTRPHILASGSRDHTIRIWNLFGYETELSPGELPNQNYPMGDADEGNHLVAILCGNWPGGHRDDVSTVCWHPSHRALASSSRDHSFKIWALPVLPPPRVPKPERDYRPILVSSPLFSTNRLSSDPIDSIQWLNEDVILVRTLSTIVTFQWLSYRRYFERGTWEPLGNTMMPVPDAAHWHDINDSRSFIIFSTFYTHGLYTYHRIGFHATFVPTPREQEALTANPNLVQNFLVAIPQAGKFPEIVLLAPTLAPADDPPEVDTRPRIDISDFISSDEDEESPASRRNLKRRRIEDEKEAAPALSMTPETAGAVGKMVSEQDGIDPPVICSITPATDTVAKSSMCINVPKTSSETDDSAKGSDSSAEDTYTSSSETSNSGSEGSDYDTDHHSESGRGRVSREGSGDETIVPRSRKRVRRIHSWLLRADPWARIVERHKSKHMYSMPAMRGDNSIITCCAISPRGAKWVLGVGQAESLFVWRLVDAQGT